MSEDRISLLKKNIMAIGRLLWEKDLVSGLNGNISARVDDQKILLTATKTCLGLLQEKDILLVDFAQETPDGEGPVSTEKRLHVGIYKQNTEIMAVIHTHTVFTNAYFLENQVFSPRIFEYKIWFGDIAAVDQRTPSVTDVAPVYRALEKNNIAVLRSHGVVATGKDLFDCFLLIQGLEEAVKMEAISKIFANPSPDLPAAAPVRDNAPADAGKKYKLFSRDQMDRIVQLVNGDERLRDLGTRTKMTMDLAVQLNETGQVYSFRFENGKIVQVGDDQDAEFLISAPEEVWRAVFNRQIDPFVATTQKKMHLRGDFAKISQWYEPCCRIFEIWQQVPII